MTPVARLRHLAKRGREALVGLAILGVALWWTAVAVGPLAWLAAPVAAGGLALLWTGLQRYRVRPGGDGPGFVEITEGRVIYFGPETGGAIALDTLTAISLVPTARGSIWRLTVPEGALAIPVAARGGEALIDAFARLPGFSLARLPAGLQPPGPAPLTVWRRPGASGVLDLSPLPPAPPPEGPG